MVSGYSCFLLNFVFVFLHQSFGRIQCLDCLFFVIDNLFEVVFLRIQESALYWSRIFQFSQVLYYIQLLWMKGILGHSTAKNSFKFFLLKDSNSQGPQAKILFIWLCISFKIMYYSMMLIAYKLNIISTLKNQKTQTFKA